MGDTSKTDSPRAQLPGAPPKTVSDYAQTCVQYVERSVGISLDFTVETLPLLDHYLREARAVSSERPETAALVATVAGCYVGEVLRLRHSLQWDAQADDPLAWRLANENDTVNIFPIALAHVALEGARAEREVEVLAFDPKLRDALNARLSELPSVDEEEYLAPSTRVEIIDIAMDVLKGLRSLAIGQS